MMHIKRWFHLSVVLVFGAFFAFQLCLQLTGVRIFPLQNEKRVLAKPPRLLLKWDTLKQFDKYYNDNFALRDILVRFNSEFRYQVFNTSPVSRVVLGENGWLFYNEDNNIESYRNVKLYSKTELDSLYEKHESIAKKLADRGIIYVFVVAPNNQSIYFENLPNWTKQKINSISRYEQVIERMGQSKHILVIDLKKVLLEEKLSHRLYYNTDTHWNDLGAYIAYREIMNSVYRRTGDREFLPIPSTDLSLSSDSAHPSGDLADMIGLSGGVIETGGMKVQIRSDFKSSKKWVVFHDSFFTAMKPFLGSRFEFSFVGHWAGWSPEVIEKYSVGATRIVLYERVERTL